jgi:N6-adenosine-specific RNA methylase IME4
MNIDTEFKNIIPPLTTEEYQQLEASLVHEGCRDALIMWNDTLLDGHNRYEICTKHNIPFKTLHKEFSDRDAAMLWIIDNQFARRNLSAYDRSVLALKYEDLLRAKAKENQLRTADNRVRQISDKQAIDVKKELGKRAGVSHDTIMKVKKIEETANEEQKQAIKTGLESINSTYTKLVKTEKRDDIIKKIQQAPIIDGQKKYGIIYADPAWQYFEGGNKNQSQHYNTMSMQEIKDLPVEKLAADDCVLFLWVTFPILPDALDVITAWGFNYSTVGFTWVKRNKEKDSWFFGLGNWTRSNAELCLIATKGSPMRKSASVSQIIDTPIEEHSKKPNMVRDKIVELMGDDIPKIELFARQQTSGWDTWGNCDFVGE